MVYARCCPLVIAAKWALFLCVYQLSSAPRAEERYYLVVFGSQTDPNIVRYSHTFATFVKATGEDVTVDEQQIESHTISWTPATLDIVTMRTEPERGTNLDLHSSLNLALSFQAKIFQFGPYQIKKELYDRALKQIARLKEGVFAYKTLDAGFRPNRASNCIHAVSDLDAAKGLLDVGTDRGEAASKKVALHLSGWILNPSITHQWIEQRLGLTKYSVVRKPLK